MHKFSCFFYPSSPLEKNNLKHIACAYFFFTYSTSQECTMEFEASNINAFYAIQRDLGRHWSRNFILKCK